MGNAATDALSQVTSRLDAETMKSILDGITVEMTERPGAQDPAVTKTDEGICKPVLETANLASTTQAYVLC